MTRSRDETTQAPASPSSPPTPGETATRQAASPVEDGAGRFPQVAGMSYSFDISAPAGSRISDVMVGEAPLDPAATYGVVTNNYVRNGGDGYKMFKEEGVTRLSEADNGLWIIDLVKQFFTRTSTTYEMVESRKARRELRFKMFGMDETNSDCISPDGKWAMVNSQVDGRIQKE